MIPQLENIHRKPGSSIAVKQEIRCFLPYPWHYHPEYEIIWVEEGYGTRFMGNHVEKYEAGDFVFISSNLPHVWKSHDDFYKKEPPLQTRCIVVQFREEVLGQDLLSLPEMKPIVKLFEKGRRGIHFPGDNHERIGWLKQMLDADPVERIILLIRLLQSLAHARNFRILSHDFDLGKHAERDRERLEKICSFALRHFMEEIQLEQVAEYVAMNKASLCRYFKARMGKTYTRFVNEIRVANACKLLVEEDRSIFESSCLSGYNNISHFNRQFRAIMQESPRSYRLRYLSVTD